MLMPIEDAPLMMGGLPIEAEPVTTAPTIVPAGPGFELIEETTWDALKTAGRQWPFDRPVLVKGGVKHWPAFRQWSFESLADLC